MTDWHRV